MEADGLLVRQVVAQREPKTFPRQGAQCERLDDVALEPARRARLHRFVGASGCVAAFFVANAFDVLSEREHPPVGIVVEVAVERDIDGDRDDGVAAKGSIRWAGCSGPHGLSGRRDERQTLGRLMAVRRVCVARLDDRDFCRASES